MKAHYRNLHSRWLAHFYLNMPYIIYVNMWSYTAESKTDLVYGLQ